MAWKAFFFCSVIGEVSISHRSDRSLALGCYATFEQYLDVG